MKQTFAYILIIIFNLVIKPQVSICQNTDKIEVSDLMIIKAGKEDHVNLGSSKAKVIEAFGRPVKTQKSYFIKFDFKGEMISYNGAQFYFMDNHLTAFELKNNQFSIKVKGTNKYAVIGDFLKGFVKEIPEDRSTTITLRDNDSYYDEVLAFTFNAKNKLLNIICGPD